MTTRSPFLHVANGTATTRLFATSGGLEPSIDITTKIFAARLDRCLAQSARARLIEAKALPQSK